MLHPPHRLALPCPAMHCVISSAYILHCPCPALPLPCTAIALYCLCPALPLPCTAFALHCPFLHCFSLHCRCPAGYIGSLSFLETILRVVGKLRSINPDLVYGELGRLWCRHGVILSKLRTDGLLEGSSLSSTYLEVMRVSASQCWSTLVSASRC